MVLKYKGRAKRVETIEDALSILDGKTMIAIGSKSAFYFIGSLATYREDIAEIEAHYRAKHEKRRIRNPEIEPFQEMANRKVLEMHVRSLPGEPKMVAFQVEGSENGELWLLCEYAQAIRHYRNEQRAVSAAV